MKKSNNVIKKKKNEVKNKGLMSPIMKNNYTLNTFHINMTLQKYINMRLNNLSKSNLKSSSKIEKNEQLKHCVSNNIIKNHQNEINLLKEENIKLNKELNDIKKLFEEKKKELSQLKEIISNENNVNKSNLSIKDNNKNYISSNTINSLDVSDCK